MAYRQLGFTLYPLVLAALLSACAAPAPSTPRGSIPGVPAATPMVLAGTEWVAFALDGVAEVSNPKPKIRWTGTDKVAGTGGCNGFVGPAVVGPNNSLHLGPLASTGRACLSMPGSQEDRFFKALELTRKVRMERDQLVLMDDSGKQLARFLKVH